MPRSVDFSRVTIIQVSLGTICSFLELSDVDIVAIEAAGAIIFCGAMQPGDTTAVLLIASHNTELTPGTPGVTATLAFEKKSRILTLLHDSVQILTSPRASSFLNSLMVLLGADMMRSTIGRHLLFLWDSVAQDVIFDTIPSLASNDNVTEDVCIIRLLASAVSVMAQSSPLQKAVRCTVDGYLAQL